MIFKYSFTKGGPYKFPLIDIIVKSIDDPSKSLKYPALLDSGAVFCVFHSEIAELLDIDLQRIKEQVAFGGVGSEKQQFKGKVAFVNIMLSQKGQSRQFDSPVVFSSEINKDGHPLLGIRGFFDKFKDITFSEERDKIVLRA